MKKSFYLASAAIVAAMLFSCNKFEAEIKPEGKSTITVELCANTADSKVTIGSQTAGKYPVTWNAERESVKMFEVTSDGNKSYNSAGDYTLGTGNKSAKFSFEIEPKQADSYDYYFFSPAAVANSLTSGKFNVKLPASQKPFATSVDTASIIMHGTSLGHTTQATGFNANFKVISAVAKMTLKNLPLQPGESVKSVSIQAKGKDFAATMNYGTDGTFSHHNSSTDKITVDVSDLTTTGNFDVWFNCWPCQMEVGDKLIITANTENSIYTREISMSAAKEFKAGCVNAITVDMASAEKPEIIEYKLTALKDIQPSDVVVITMKVGDVYYAMSNDKGTNSAPTAVEVATSNNSITSPDDNLKWNISAAEGAYVISPDGDASKVLYATNDNNGARVGTKVNASWVLDAALDNKYLKYNTTDFDRNLGVYNKADWRTYQKKDGAAHGNIKDQQVFFFAYGDSREPQNLSFPQEKYEVELGGTFNAPTVSGVQTTATYSSSNTDVASVNETSGAVTIKAAGTTTITATAESSATYKSGTASYILTVKNNASGQTYASLADLVADGAPDGRNVTVTLTNEEITGIYVTKSGYRNGIFFKVGQQEVEIFYYDVPENWEVGGKVSGTLTDCPWKLYNSTWELAPEKDTWAWTNLEYTAPAATCATPVISIDGSGKATITCETAGATIKYAISDTEPASFTNTYTAPVQLTEGQTIWAKATKASMLDSKVVSMMYVKGGSTVTKLISEISGNPENGTKVSEMKLDNVITATASELGNNGKIYGTGTEWRFYQSDNGTLTITASSGHSLKAVTFTYTTEKTGCLLCGTDILASDTAYSVSGSSVTFAVGNTGTATNGQVRITKISVTYN